MRRFIIESNIARFEKLLGADSDPETTRRVRELLAEARRELALLIASELGVRPPEVPGRGGPAPTPPDMTTFIAQVRASPKALMLLDPGPGLRIVEVTEAFADVAWTTRDAIVGRSLFEVFPENPGDAGADGISNLTNSLARAARSGRSDAMPIQRYDVQDGDGRFAARYWRPINAPVFDDNGHLLFLMQEVEEVSAADAMQQGVATP